MSDEKWGEVYTIQTAWIAELEAELARSEAERSICVEDTIVMSHELEAERKAREGMEKRVRYDVELTGVPPTDATKE